MDDELISNAKYAKRDRVAPQTPIPAVPFGNEETHRSPTGWFDGLHPLTWPSSVHIWVADPPAAIGASSSSAPPSRWGVYGTPPV